MDCQQQDAYQFYKIQCYVVSSSSQSITLRPIAVDAHLLVRVDSQSIWVCT